MEPDISPTGDPVIPVKAVPWLVALAATITALAQTIPNHTIGGKILGILAPLLTLLVGASPGIRR